MLTALLEKADYSDVKTVHSTNSLSQFISQMFSFSPWWLRGLYRIRGGFVRLIGQRQQTLPASVFAPRTVPMNTGEKIAFFTLEQAEDNRYWQAGICEPHLCARLAILREPLGNTTQFRVFTIVNFNAASGRLYFAVIKPFHHVVVGAMARAAAVSQKVAA